MMQKNTPPTRKERLKDHLRDNLKRRKQAPKPGLHRPKKPS